MNTRRHTDEELILNQPSNPCDWMLIENNARFVWSELEGRNSVSTKPNKPGNIRDFCDYCAAHEIMLAHHTITPPSHTHKHTVILFPELLHLGHGDGAALTEGD